MYFGIWTPVYALGADLTAYRQTLLDPDRSWDEPRTEGTPGYTQEDQAGGYGAFGIVSAFAGLEHHNSSGLLDAISALQNLSGKLKGITGKGTVDVVLMSDMLNAAAPLNISVPIGLASGPTSLIAQVQASGLMPDCRGWHVYMLGAGLSANGSVGDVMYQQLKAFWTAFFSRCGGQIVYYDTQLAQFPVQGSSQVRIKAKTVAIRSPGGGETQQVVVTLPDDVLFASGSAQLSAAAGPVLTQLLPIIESQYPTGSVQVTGYTGLPSF